MSITYRNLKGSPLSADELDQNFRDLHERLEYLETSFNRQNLGGIAQIFQEGSEIFFENTAGDIMGRLKFPQLQLNPRGAWSPHTEYAFYDVCLFNGKSYLCNTAHQSAESFEEHSRQWDVIFSMEA